MTKVDSVSIKVRTVVEVLILPIITYGVFKLDRMADNVQELNTKVAIVITERQVDKESLKDIELRIRELEKRVK